MSWSGQLQLAMLVTLALCFFGCKPSKPLERSSIGGRESSDAEKNTKNGTPLISDSDKNSDDDDPKKKKKKKNTDKDSDDEDDDDDENDDDDDDDEIAAIVYPQLAFKGNGYTTYQLKDRLTMRMDIETNLDDDALTIDTKTAKVECGSKSGCNQKDVDESVNSKSIGVNTYQRSSRTELKNLKSDGFNAAYFAIFAKSVRGKNGFNFTFEKPVPVYPWPAAISRYEELSSGAISWSAIVTADRYVSLNPNISDSAVQGSGESFVKSGNAIKQFNLTVAVSMQAAEGDLIKLTFDITIPEDKERMIYKYFPLPKTTIYTIDTAKKDIKAVHMVNWSNGDKSKDPEESVLDYKLCSKTVSGEVKQFSCD